MTKLWNRRLALAFAGTASLALIAPAHAEEPYPSKPITLVVPYAAGGGSDILARIVATGMSSRLGQTIIVDNKPGASTGIAASTVARAKPDGYTLLLGNTSTFVVNELLNAKVGYNPKDLALLGMVAEFPMVYVVSSTSPIKSMPDLVAAAKAGHLAYASPGTGSPHHLGMEALKYRAGVDITHAAYRGVSPAFPDIIANRVAVMFSDYAAAGGLLKDGKLRPLAVGGAQPYSFLPGVPTMEQLGYKDFQITGWQGLAVPAGTPQPIVAKLVGALRDTLADREVQQRLRETGLEPAFQDPTGFAAHIGREREQLGNLIKANKITLE